MPSKSFKTTIVRDGSMCVIPIPFDPKPVFGKVRAPVEVTVNGYTFRSTISTIGGPPCVPLRRSNREAAGLEGNETLQVTMALDEKPRVVSLPPDLEAALRAAPRARARWQALAFTHQREHVEAILEAKRPETRARRIERAIAMLSSQGAKGR